jgi:hypothetical protein
MFSGVNPRIAWEKSVQVSGWASGLKTRTFGRKRPAELYEFLPRNPGIYTHTSGIVCFVSRNVSFSRHMAGRNDSMDQEQQNQEVPHESDQTQAEPLFN